MFPGSGRIRWATFPRDTCVDGGNDHFKPPVPILVGDIAICKLPRGNRVVDEETQIIWYYRRKVRILPTFTLS